MAIINKFSGGGEKLQIGDITTNPKYANDPNFLRCDGRAVESEKLARVLPYTIKFNNINIPSFPSSYNNKIQKIGYGNDNYVITSYCSSGGEKGYLIVSSDLTSWRIATSTLGGFSAVKYCDKLWCIGGDRGYFSMSLDLINFTVRNIGFTYAEVKAIECNNGMWAVGGEYGNFCTSSDTINWVNRVTNIDTYSIKYGAGIWCIGGKDGKVSTSTNLIDWIPRNINFGTNSIYCIEYNNEIWAAGGNENCFATSSDTINWVRHDFPGGVSRTIFDIAYGEAFGGGLWSILGDDLRTSSNLSDFTDRYGNSSLTAMLYINSTWIIGRSTDPYVVKATVENAREVLPTYTSPAYIKIS